MTTKTDLSPVAPGFFDSVQQWNAEQAAQLAVLHPFEIDPTAGDTIPPPHIDQHGNELRGPANAVYYFANTTKVTLDATKSLADGRYDGQQLRLVARGADVVFPGGIRGGALTLSSGSDVLLLWDATAGVWSAPAGGGGVQVITPTAAVADLNALTETDVSVGDVAWSSDAGPLRCYAATATGSSWEALTTDRILLRALTTAASLRYFDMMGGDVENGVLTQITNQFTQKNGFRVETLDLGVQDANPGNTTIGIHKNGNTTPEDTDVQNPGVAPIWWRVEFAVEFAADDILAISVVPAGSGTTIHGHVYIRTLYPEPAP